LFICLETYIYRGKIEERAYSFMYGLQLFIDYVVNSHKILNYASVQRVVMVSLVMNPLNCAIWILKLKFIA